MISYKELHEQNHNITELSSVLRYLFKDRSMCDTDTCCKLFMNYVDQVQAHVEKVDKNVCSELLQHNDESSRNIVNNFMSGSVEVKRILHKFTRDWCPAKSNGELKIKDYDKFLADTDELFDIVLKRILDETEHLYPLTRSIRQVA